MMISLLVENATGRFKRDYTMNIHLENLNKKESTYQKLSVFKEIENVNRTISLDEEAILVETYAALVNHNPSICNMIS
jgi:hypothetical protein